MKLRVGMMGGAVVPFITLAMVVIANSGYLLTDLAMVSMGHYFFPLVTGPPRASLRAAVSSFICCCMMANCLSMGPCSPMGRIPKSDARYPLRSIILLMESGVGGIAFFLSILSEIGRASCRERV